VNGISIYLNTRRGNGRQMADNLDMVDATQDGLEAVHSLRRRGLISAAAYEQHLAAVAARPVRPSVLLQPLALLMALLGGVLGVFGAVVQEVQSGGIGAAFIAAPIIEEALKPAGIYILLIVWPRALAGRLHTATLTAISGLCFGLIESYVYVTWYYPEGDSAYVLYRFTVPVMMHMLASFLVGFGLSRQMVDWAAGRASFPTMTRNFYVAAVLLHAIYNTTVVALDIAGVLEF
jgi:RsiW-degrading membrane proteinase PrsW (M82 family)